MEALAKTPVEIVQELIAIYTTRKEAASKFSDKVPGFDSLLIIQQTDDSIAALMTELSHFGDGVNSEAERENEYQQLYKQSLGNIEAMSGEEARRIFDSLESSLKNYYQQTLQTNQDLPESLQQLLQKQEDGLKSS